MGSTGAEWTADANESFRISLVRTKEDKAGLTSREVYEDFNPTFTYPIFGDDQKIYGYKDLVVDLKFASGSLAQYLKVSCSSRLPPSSAVDDIGGTLRQFIPSDYITNEQDFLKRVEEDATAFKPFGRLIHSYSRSAHHRSGGHHRGSLNHRSGSGGVAYNSENAEIVDFEVYHSTWNTPGFKEYHRRMQLFILLYIEAGSYIQEEEDAWEFVVLYEKRRRRNSPHIATYHFVGYSSLYPFYCFPEKTRMRLSQFVILPPFQQEGHGSALYSAIYQHVLSDPLIAELTVEDPAEAFEDLRDRNDLKMLLNNERFMREALGLPVSDDEGGSSGGGSPGGSSVGTGTELAGGVGGGTGVVGGGCGSVTCSGSCLKSGTTSVVGSIPGTPVPGGGGGGGGCVGIGDEGRGVSPVSGGGPSNNNSPTSSGGVLPRNGHGTSGNGNGNGASNGHHGHGHGRGTGLGGGTGGRVVKHRSVMHERSVALPSSSSSTSTFSTLPASASTLTSTSGPSSTATNTSSTPTNSPSVSTTNMLNMPVIPPGYHHPHSRHRISGPHHHHHHSHQRATGVNAGDPTGGLGLGASGGGTGGTGKKLSGKLGPPADRKWVEKWRVDLKIAQRQFNRLIEMLTLKHMDELDVHAMKQYRLQVKQRLYRFNYEVLMQLDKEERQAKLEETFQSVKQDYQRILASIH